MRIIFIAVILLIAPAASVADPRHNAINFALSDLFRELAVGDVSDSPINFSFWEGFSVQVGASLPEHLSAEALQSSLQTAVNRALEEGGFEGTYGQQYRRTGIGLSPRLAPISQERQSIYEQMPERRLLAEMNRAEASLDLWVDIRERLTPEALALVDDIEPRLRDYIEYLEFVMSEENMSHRWCRTALAEAVQTHFGLTLDDASAGDCDYYNVWVGYRRGPDANRTVVSFRLSLIRFPERGPTWHLLSWEPDRRRRQ